MSDTAEGIYPKHFEDIQFASEANKFNDDIASNTAASHAQSHNIASHSDTSATGAELNTLTGGGETTLHSHAVSGSGTQYLSIPGVAFVAKVDAEDYSLTVNGSYDCNSSQTLFTPIYLPHGASLSAVVFYGNDSGEAWEFIRTQIQLDSGAGVIASANINSTDTSISGGTINNNTYKYYIRIVTLDSNDIIYGGRITYTT